MAKKPNRPKDTYIVSLDEVKITRKGETAIVEYLEPNIETTHYTIGPKLSKMTDQEILDMHNDGIIGRNELALEYRDQALVEIPLGSPQIEYHQRSDQWCPRGDILRCTIEEDEAEDYRLPSIVIDDTELTWQEFGRMLLTHAGWGMRIAFVGDANELHQNKRIEVREPKKPEATDG